MRIANILSIFLGIVLIILSLQWILYPEAAAESLNMIYLEGEGRNTQIRDFTAFFLQLVKISKFERHDLKKQEH